jgi:hypothetical protein
MALQTDTSRTTSSPRVRLEGWRAELAASVLAALALLAVQAASGFPSLFDSSGDNDSVMRLVQIRDLITGQPWFDLHQDRMGVEGGFLMHWSRLVDAPVAAIIIMVTALSGSHAAGEIAAALIWPALLFSLALFLLLRLARRYAGAEAFLPALVIGALTLNAMGIFLPRAFDHHNLQLVLFLAAATFLALPGWRAAAGAGACCATMLAVGMEVAPYVAVAGGFAAATLLPRQTDASTAVGFGLGFAATALVALVATVSPSSWRAAQCDAYSARLGIVAVLAGLGLAAAAGLISRCGRPSRIAALALLAVVVGAAAVLLVPKCFADPYAGIDPRMRKFWLNGVSEAQPLWSMLRFDLAAVPQHYATPLIAMGLLTAAVLRTGLARTRATLIAFLVAAILVSIWQVRGSTFALPLAVVPLAGWIAAARMRLAQSQPRATVKLVVAWLASLSIVWGAASTAIFNVAAGQKQTAGSADASPSSCYAEADYRALAGEPAGTVMTLSNLGSSVLANTPHRVLAGPYHRNIAGNVATLDALMGTPEEAHAVLGRERISILAVCSGNDESSFLSKQVPNGFLATLLGGKIPSWLEPVPGTADQPLVLYRVRGH